MGELVPEAAGAQRQPLASAADSMQLSCGILAEKADCTALEPKTTDHQTGAHAHAAASISV